MTEQTDAAEVEGCEHCGRGHAYAGFALWLAAREAAAEVRGAQAERERRMDYAVVKGYELGHVEGAQAVLAAVEALHSGWHLCEDGMAGERWNDPLECDYKVEDPCETLRAARAAAAAAGGGA